MLRRLVVMAASFVVVLLSSEVVARLFVPAPSFVGGMPFEPELGFHGPGDLELPYRDEHGPLVAHYDELGYRGPTLPDGPAPAGVERVLVLGDSFVQAYGVRDERILQAVLERELRAAGRDVEVHSAASDGFGTTQELLLHRRYRERVDADVVLLVFFSGNDVANNAIHLAGRTQVSAGDYVRPYLVFDEGAPRLTYLEPTKAFLRRASGLFAAVDERLLKRGLVRPLGGDGPREPLEPLERIEAGLLPLAHFGVQVEDPDDAWRSARATTEAILRAFADEVRSDGAELVVGIVPDVVQVQTAAALEVVEGALAAAGRPSLGELLDLDAPEAWLTEFLAAEGIRHATCVRELREGVRATSRSFYREDGHLNGRGHEVAGRCFAAELLGEREEPPFVASEGVAVDLVARTVERGWVDFERDPEEHCVAGTGVAPWLGRARGFPDGLWGWSADEQGIKVPVSPLPGTLVAAGVLNGDDDAEGELRIAGRRASVPTNAVFWLQVPVERGLPHRLARLRPESAGDRLVVTKVGLADPVWALASIEQDLAEFRATVALADDERHDAIRAGLDELEATAVALVPVAASSARVADGTEATLEGIWNVRRRTTLLAALHTTLVAPDERLLRRLTAAEDVTRRAAVGFGERVLRGLDRDAPSPRCLELVARLGLALDEVGLLEGALVGLERLDHAPELSARGRDRLAVRRGDRQPFGTEGVWISGHWFGPPEVAPEDLARNRAELGLEPLETARARLPRQRVVTE